MIPEDLRSFAEFFPEPESRHRVHYFFAHRFLPEYVQQNPRAFLSYLFCRDTPAMPNDGTRFIQSRWSMIFEPRMGLAPMMPSVFRRVTDLRLTRHVVAEKPVALIHMPAPERTAEAYLVAVVLLADVLTPEQWPGDAEARVFTLELTEGAAPPEAVVCEWTKEGTHLNYGQTIAPSPQSFLSAIDALLATPTTLPMAMFRPPEPK